MRLLRGLLLLTLILALLPWGAYVNGPARFAAFAVAKAEAALAPEAREGRAVALAAKRPCPQKTPPGSPCGAELGLLLAAASSLGGLAGRVWPPSEGSEPTGLSRAPPLEPPRLA